MKKLFILIAAVAFVAAYTVPVMAAAEWNFYGSARMSTFYDTYNEEASATGYDDSDLTWGLQGNSRIGARVKAGDIGGGFEYGTGVNVRLLYGTWNFGGGEILVGQHYTPINFFPSNQVWGSDNDLLPYGGIYAGRRPMIQVSAAGFKFAAVQPFTGDVTGSVNTDTSVPRLEVTYAAKLGPVTLTPMVGWNKYDEVDALDNGTSITSYIYGFEVGANFGPVYIKGNYFGGLNLGQFGMWEEGNSNAGFNAVTGEVLDNESQGWLAVVGFKVNDVIAFEAGYGTVAHSRDDFVADDDTASMYVQATINIAKGFFIVPEIGVVDFKDSSTGIDQGKLTYFGAKWQINF